MGTSLDANNVFLNMFSEGYNELEHYVKICITNYTCDEWEKSSAGVLSGSVKEDKAPDRLPPGASAGIYCVPSGIAGTIRAYMAYKKVKASDECVFADINVPWIGENTYYKAGVGPGGSDYRVVEEGHFREFTRGKYGNKCTVYLRIYKIQRPTTESLKSGEVLHTGDRLVSANSKFSCVYEPDGNLVVYEGSKSMWAPNTLNAGAGSVTQQADGNLVLRGADGKVWWQSGKVSTGDAVTVMENDGNLVTYMSGKPIWDQYTEGNPDLE